MICKILFREKWCFSPETLENILNTGGGERLRKRGEKPRQKRKKKQASTSKKNKKNSPRFCPTSTLSKGQQRTLLDPCLFYTLGKHNELK